VTILSSDDLAFRPETYWPDDATGLETERPRKALDRATPFGPGTDFLPDYLDDEVEIACVSLQSTMGDVISVRARREGDVIRYRVVDEYEDPDDEDAPDERWTPGFAESRQSLTMAEMIDLMDRTTFNDWGNEGIPSIKVYVGLVQSIMNPMLDELTTREEREEHRYFASVDSAWYPLLDAHYEREIDAWVVTGNLTPPVQG